MKIGFVYIMSNVKRNTLYIGVTSNIERRILEHKVGIGSKFTSKYNLHHLLYFEKLPTIGEAIDREKKLKNWHKEWKWNLIKEFNSKLEDLAQYWYRPDELNSSFY